MNMFIIVFLLILALILYFTFRDWLFSTHLFSRGIQKIHRQLESEISLGKWEEANEHLQALYKYKKEIKSAYLFEIKILIGKGKWEEALTKAETASRLYPEELLFRLEEAKILTFLGRYQEALETFNVCMPIVRQESDLIAYAKAHLYMEGADKCLDILEPLLKVSHSGEILELMASAFFEKKEFKKSLETYLKCLSGGRENCQIFCQVAHCYRALGQIGKAEEMFRKLLEKDPKDLSLLLGLGSCLQEKGQFHKALLIYQTSPLWEIKPLPLVKEAALSALKAKKYAQAERYFLEVIQKDTLSAETLSFYGYALQCQQKWKEAELVYLRMTHLFPSQIYGYRALAWLFGVGLATHLTPEQGLQFAEFSLKMKNDLLSWEILSAVEARTGNFSKAYQIQQALAPYDKDPESRMRRQNVLRTLRKNLPLEETHVCKERIA